MDKDAEELVLDVDGDVYEVVNWFWYLGDLLSVGGGGVGWWQRCRQE